MTASLKNYYDGEWVDVSKYLIGSDAIPGLLCNRDLSLIIGSSKIEIAGTIRDLRGSDYEFEAGDLFTIELDGTFLWGGQVDTSEYSYSALKFDINLTNTLNNLKTNLIQYDSLHTQFASIGNGLHYNPNALSFNMPIVSVLWMLESMFVINGLTLDTTDVADTVLFTRTPGAPLGFDPAVDVKYKHLIIIEDTLWCINQSVARSHTIIDDTAYDYSTNKIYCWDLVKDVTSYIRVGLKQTGIYAFELIPATDNYTISDSAKYEYARRKIAAESNLLFLACRYSYHDGLQFYKSTADTLLNTNVTLGGGKESISFYNNFIIWFTDVENTGEDYYDAVVVTTIFSPQLVTDFIILNNTNNANFNPLGLKVREKVANCLEEEINTEYQPTYNTIKSHAIDAKWAKSKLIQETYDV